MKRKQKRIMAFILTAGLALGQLGAITYGYGKEKLPFSNIKAEEQRVKPMMSSDSGEDYDIGDVQVFQAILSAHPSLKEIGGLDVNSPESWEESGIVLWEDSSPQRIIIVDLTGLNLTGDLDISGLTALEQFGCSQNQLTGTLNLSKLMNLKYLDCSR